MISLEHDPPPDFPPSEPRLLPKGFSPVFDDAESFTFRITFLPAMGKFYRLVLRSRAGQQLQILSFF